MLVSAVQIATVMIGIILILSIAILFSHAFWMHVRDRRDAADLARGKSILFGLLRPGEAGAQQKRAARMDRSQIEWLRTLPFRTRTALLVPIARSIHADTSGRFLELARQIGLVIHAESLCQSRWWWRRLEGARLRSLLGGGEQTMLRLLRDRHPAVRAQAAEWAANHPTPRVVATLLELFNDPESFSRFVVQDTIVRLGGLAVEKLAEYLERVEDHEAADALRVAQAIADPRFLPAAIRHVSNANALVRARAVALVGTVGGSDHVALVSSHLSDGTPEVRVAAARALGRMGHWPCVSEISRLLRDPSWDVRRAAGLALRDLGSPGLVMLRKMTGDSNHFAADMAKQVLDLPASVAGSLA